MDSFKVIEIKKSVFEGNERRAGELRAELGRRGLFLLNLMSSPGSGKTTTLLRTIEALRGELDLGVLEADIDSDVDARAVHEAGARAIQLHTGGMCHLDAEMTRRGLEALGTEGLDCVILENIGNLICTADFDTGASRSAMILSVPEGDDKPLKYPHMFEVVDLVLVNKIDALPLFDFDLGRFRERLARLNPRARVLPVSAKTGEGMGAWADWLRGEIGSWKLAAGRRGQEGGRL
ncbi:MAG TPA: hydrogenase nickel incorporation protein HypB [Spirochaetales bacterium]|nr:hydrogenase nickel incorporation protein HypB [Spirochaetales bacterium]HRY53194.1 hydrogenase nickel incorporation protein HypB [Spirochaetia bacterium]HRZ64159.1 hydrogenase nickel incorporation protein HypB [Spirochaetia bacterium]